MLPILPWIILGLPFLVVFTRAMKEGERRAALRAGLVVVVAAAGTLTSYAIGSPLLLITSGLLGGALLIGILLLFLPIGKIRVEKEIPDRRVDERDTVLARAALEPGSRRYSDYYAAHPERERIDEQWRRLPGVLGEKSLAADAFSFAAAAASFETIGYLRSGIFAHPVEAVPWMGRSAADLDPEERTQRVKELVLYYGAKHVGITELKDYHLYSHSGRGSDPYGGSLKAELPHAVVFTVEMDYRMVQRGPAAEEVMESARQYARAAQIAAQTANFLRILGYQARPHIDEDYRLICPLAARDAGLGEIGRFGYLISPDLGPRVRIAAVTTDAPLQNDEYRPDASVIDFCSFCEKCADVCPAQAVPRGERREHDGALQWKIDAAACFRYWNTAGTDCGRCMAVCPYSHRAIYTGPIVRGLIRRSGFFRRFFVFLDDFLYGKIPPPAH